MDYEDGNRQRSSRSVLKRLTMGAGLLLIVGFMSGVIGPNRSASGSPTVMTPEQASQIRSELDQHLKSSSVEQQLALQDGRVEPQEIESLAKLASECSVDRGNPPIKVSFDGDVYQWTVDFGFGASRSEERMSEVDECWYTNVGLAEQYYGLQRVQPVEKQMSFNKHVAACLTARGFDGDGWPRTKAEIDPSVESDCVDEAEGA